MLNETTLQTGTHHLANVDPAMAMVFERYGYPPLWARQPGFATLVHIILEQQVSLASANAAFERLKVRLSGTGIAPGTFLTLDDVDLSQIGFSRQKMTYVRHLATALIEGSFDLEALNHLSDDAVRTEMTKLKGIGHWTADIYLSECLLRPDILPKGDIAMLEAFKVLRGLATRPDHETFLEGTEHWRPWRSVGARMLWHYYLSSKKEK
jgi:DNA-3-methyladenine glycosylase II